MGYETKIIIVQKHDRGISNTLKFGEKIAEFNLCKMDYSGPYMRKLEDFRKTDCFYYMDDGDTRITKDKYGDILKEINLAALIKILKKEDQSYFRIPAIIGTLESIVEYMKNYKNIVALHFGY